MAPKNHRMCISCRQSVHKNQLWRVVRTYPNGHIQLDTGMGRSAYICQQASCLQSAQKKRRLSRALRTNVSDDIYTQLANRVAEPDKAIHPS